MKMCSALAGLGHTVNLFAKTSKLTEDPYDFYGVTGDFQLYFRPKEHSMSVSFLLGWRIWKWILKWQIKVQQPDLIYSRDARALYSVRSLGIPFIFEAHILPKQPERQKWMFDHPSFRRLVVISKALKDDYLAQFRRLDDSKVLVAHDAASPPPSPIDPVLRGNDGRLRVGYIGNLYPGRGLEIIPKLAELCPWAHFHIVGGSEESLEHWKRRLASTPNITLHGFVPHRETAGFLVAFDVVIAPYQSRVQAHGGKNLTQRWMSPLKIFEYMAYGKPIIASDLPVLKEVLEDERNALLVPPAEIDSWAKAIARLRGDAALRTRLGRAALQDFNTHYSWESRASAVLEGIEVRDRRAKRSVVE
jgi:glycosyltransferase involved in cell wall biosynthesis